MRTILRTFLFLSILVATSGHLLAQATATGNIIGIVSDATGAAVPQATVTALNKGTATPRTTTTNAAGEYRFDLLPIGTYTITVQATGFSAAKADGLELLVGTTLTANIPVQAGRRQHHR